MENVKKYKITIIITTLITLLPILFGLIVWNRLPEQIATHWGADGQADGYSGKTFAVFGMPCILAVLQLFVSFITLNDPKRRNIHKKPLTLVLWVIPVMSLIVNVITYGIALGMEINVGIIVSILVGVLFIILGNYMPKLQQTVHHLRQLYAETAAELYCRHPGTLDAEQYRELEPHPQAGRKNVYTGRIFPDHHRLSRQRNGRLRNPRRAHRDRSDLRGSAGSVFVLAVQKRGINSGFI